MDELRQSLQKNFAQQEGAAPDFKATLATARDRVRVRRRRKAAAGGLLVAGLATLVFLTEQPQPGLVSEAELLGSTSWSAPSDVLLPEHQFDIYQDLPDLLESTKPAGGTLL